MGPSWGHLHYKNLSIDDAIAVIEAEVQEAEAADATLYSLLDSACTCGVRGTVVS